MSKMLLIFNFELFKLSNRLVVKLLPIGGRDEQRREVILFDNRVKILGITSEKNFVKLLSQLVLNRGD